MESGRAHPKGNSIPSWHGVIFTSHRDPSRGLGRRGDSRGALDRWGSLAGGFVALPVVFVSMRPIVGKEQITEERCQSH